MTVTVQHKSRIPMALQSIFLASNRGKEVHVAPPSQIACKTFTKPSMHLPSMSSSTSKKRSFMRRVIFGRKDCNTPPPPLAEESTADMSVELSPASSHTNGSVRKARKPPAPTLSPRQYMDGMLHTRGYGSTPFKTLETAYYNKPSELQQASYDRYLADLIKTNDIEAFTSIMNSGISPNPCNSFGESLLHMVCRRGQLDFLKVMLDAGASVQVSDDFGRTPLHDACWASEPALELVELLLQADPSLMRMQDSRGSLPLDYIRKDHWNEWLQWLAKHKDQFWPNLKQKQQGQDQQEQQPALCTKPAHSNPISDPANALSLELARMVVSGKMKPTEARYMMMEQDRQDATTANDDSDDDDEDYSDSDEESDLSDSEDGDEEEEDFGFDPEEMNQLIHRISAKQ